MNKNKLNKQIISIGIVFLLSIISLSGCIDEQKQVNVIENDNQDDDISNNDPDDQEENNNNSDKKIEYTLNIATSGNGSGTINIDPSSPYNYGDIVTLEAIPDDGSYFYGWSGNLSGSLNPDTITIIDNMTVDAEFLISEINEDDIFIGTWTGNKEFEQEIKWKTITMVLTKLIFKDENNVEVYMTMTHPRQGSQSSSCLYDLDGNTLNLEFERGTLSFIYSFNDEHDVLYLDDTEFEKV